MSSIIRLRRGVIGVILLPCHRHMPAPRAYPTRLATKSRSPSTSARYGEAVQSNDIVVMDNCRIHLGPGIRAAIEKAHATLRYLPKYSPDLNPIEMAYSKFKAFLRNGGYSEPSCYLSFSSSSRPLAILPR